MEKYAYEYNSEATNPTDVSGRSSHYATIIRNFIFSFDIGY